MRSNELTPEQETRINEVLKQWHEAGRTTAYNPSRYDEPDHAKHYHVGGKYVRLDDGTSGAFMAEIESGIVYEIKAYGVPNKKKIVGEIWKPTFNGAQLQDARYIRGSYDNRAHLWIPKEPNQ